MIDYLTQEFFMKYYSSHTRLSEDKLITCIFCKFLNFSISIVYKLYQSSLFISGSYSIWLLRVSWDEQ